MGTIKQTTRRATGETKEAIAENVGDGKLQEDAGAEQREAEEDPDDSRPSLPNPFSNLDRLT